MKTFEMLCKRFNRIHKGYRAIFDSFFSYRGYYNVTIIDDRKDLISYGLSTVYTFKTCKEFKEWIDGVIMD